MKILAEKTLSHVHTHTFTFTLSGGDDEDPCREDQVPGQPRVQQADGDKPTSAHGALFQVAIDNKSQVIDLMKLESQPKKNCRFGIKTYESHSNSVSSESVVNVYVANVVETRHG